MMRKKLVGFRNFTPILYHLWKNLACIFAKTKNFFVTKETVLY